MKIRSYNQYCGLAYTLDIVRQTYTLHIDNEMLQVQIKDDAIMVQQGEALKADVVFHTDMPSYLGLLSGEIQPDEAVEKCLIRIEGDPEALRRFLNICGSLGFSP